MDAINRITGGQNTMNGGTTKGTSIQDLRKQYPHLQLSAQSFGDDAAVKEYARNQSGKYNVAIDPRALSRMAEDSEFSDKIHGILAGVKDGDDWLEKETNKTENNVTTKLIASGTIIDKDGNSSGWSVVQATGTGQSHFSKAGNREGLLEKLAKAREERAEDQKQLERKRQERLEVDASLEIENNTSATRGLDTQA